MKKKVWEYIITDCSKYGGPLTLCCDKPYPKGGILFRGDTATVFSTYQRARRAIKRTSRYVKKQNYNWEAWNFKPMRLER